MPFSRAIFSFSVGFFLLIGLPLANAAEGKAHSIILATTTSTQDTGLLDFLIPVFEKKSGYTVKAISVGTGQSLELAAKGDADAALVHAPSLEKKYVAEGKLLNRRLVMYNDFVLLGPAEDPAKIKGMKTARDAMQKIARSQSRFVSRGDHSGTHSLEKALWHEAQITPQGSWYIESGQGMAAALRIANERSAYTIADRGTFLAMRNRLTLPILLEGDRALLNIYSVMEVNPANGPRINAAGGRALADFLVSAEAQALIKTYGVDSFGETLFVPVAGKREDELGV